MMWRCDSVVTSLSVYSLESWVFKCIETVSLYQYQYQYHIHKKIYYILYIYIIYYLITYIHFDMIYIIVCVYIR